MESRVTKSIKNTGFGLVGMAISMIVQFASRTVFIYLLGVEYNGINGLFTNILQVLNLAELGFAFSIAYALYGPLQEKDKQKISAIMNYLRKIYRIIALSITIAGLACVPFLQFLIKEDLSQLPFTLNEIRLFFVVYLLNTVLSYVFSYKRTIITADQNSYLVSNVDNISNILLYGVQIALLFVWRNYYLYLGIMAAKTLIANIVLTLLANKKYPYLNENRHLVLGNDDRKAIMKNVGAMFFHKIGGVIIYSTTTIIISAFVGLVDASKYSNYILIVNAVNTFINIIFNAITASVGNLCTTASREYQYRVFRRVSFVSNFFAVFCFTCYAGMFNPFVALWVGADMTFDFAVVVAISASAMVTLMRASVNTFKNAQGLFTKDWYKPLGEAVLGVALGIAFSFNYGTLGVVAGYTLSSLLFAVPIENIVLFKYGFDEKKIKTVLQFLRIIGVIVLSVVSGAIAVYLCSLLGDGIVWFIVKALICMSVSTLLFVIVTIKSDAFRYYVALARSILAKIFKRKKIENPDETTEVK